MDPASWPPELQVLAINAGCVAVAYLGLYPSLRRPTLGAVMATDAAVSAAALVAAGLLFAGSGIGFSLILAEAPWWAFSVLTMTAIEAPFSARLAWRAGFFGED